VSRPRGTKIDGGQPKSEAQPLAVPITPDWYHRLLKIGTVSLLASFLFGVLSLRTFYYTYKRNQTIGLPRYPLLDRLSWAN
jgi:hypothetical protein